MSDAEMTEGLMMWEKGIECDGVLTLWPETTVMESDREELLEFFLLKFEIEPVIVGTVVTLPNPEHREMEEPKSGGRRDFFFYVKSEDVPKFAIARLQYGMRWWEDVFYNKGQGIYPIEFREAYPCLVEDWGEEE